MGRNLQCTFNEKSVKAVNFCIPAAEIVGVMWETRLKS